MAENCLNFCCLAACNWMLTPELKLLPRFDFKKIVYKFWFIIDNSTYIMSILNYYFTQKYYKKKK